jgi:hypothetical protein
MNVKLFIKWLINRPKTGNPVRPMSWSHYRNMQIAKLEGMKRKAANRARGRKAWETRQLTLTLPG